MTVAHAHRPRDVQTVLVDVGHDDLLEPRKLAQLGEAEADGTRPEHDRGPLRRAVPESLHCEDRRAELLREHGDSWIGVGGQRDHHVTREQLVLGKSTGVR